MSDFLFLVLHTLHCRIGSGLDGTSAQKTKAGQLSHSPHLQGLFCLLVLIACLPCTAWAANYNVTNLNDAGAGSLRQAITDAGDADTITINVTGTISLASRLPNLNSITFVNGANITLSKNNEGVLESPLRMVDGATISGTLPSIISNVPGPNSDAGNVLTYGSFTLADPLSGTYSATGTNGADGFIATVDLTLDNITGSITSTTTASGTARGLYSDGGDITIGDLTGTITVNGARTAYGIQADALISTGDISGTIDVDSAWRGYGLQSGSHMSVGDISGTIDVHSRDSSQDTYGLRSLGSLALDGVSGSVTTISDQGDAYGLYASDTLASDSGATNISGTITAEGKGEAIAIRAGGGTTLNISGTVTATSSSGSTAYAIYSRDNHNDTVTLQSGVSMTGDIDLFGGTNLLTMNGAGTLNGTLKNISTLTKNGAGNWDTTGNIETDTMNLSAGKLTVTVEQANTATVTVTNALTNDGEMAFKLDTFVPGGTTFTVVSTGAALAGAGSYTTDSRFVTLGQTANTITMTKASYTNAINSNDSDLKKFASALDAGSGSATDSMKGILNQLENTPTNAEFTTYMDQLTAQPLGALRAMGVDTAHTISQATQTRMAELRAYQIMLAELGNSPDPDDPETWPLIATVGGLSGRLSRSPEVKPESLHLRMVGTTGGMDSYDIHDGYDYKTILFSGGYDKILGDDFLLGISGGYSVTMADYEDINESSSEMKSYNLGIYGSWFDQDWYLDALLSCAFNRYDTTRPIPFRNDVAIADASGRTISAKTSVGYRFDFSGVGLTPMASLELTRLKLQGYTESGAGAANLIVPTTHSTFLESGLGAKIDTTWDANSWRIVPQASIMWMHEWLTQAQHLTYSMTGIPGTNFVQSAPESANDSFRFGTGLTALDHDGLALTIKYQGEIEKHADSHSLMLEAQWAF